MGAGHIALIALVTLPIAGIPLTLWLLADYYRHTARCTAFHHWVRS